MCGNREWLHPRPRVLPRHPGPSTALSQPTSHLPWTPSLHPLRLLRLTRVRPGVRYLSLGVRAPPTGLSGQRHFSLRPTLSRTGPPSRGIPGPSVPSSSKAFSSNTLSGTHPVSLSPSCTPRSDQGENERVGTKGRFPTDRGSTPDLRIEDGESLGRDSSGDYSVS